MKIEDMVKEIHETVIDIKLHQARRDEHIKENRKDIAEHKEEIAKLKTDSSKVKGAGALAGLILSAKFLWEGLVK